MRGAFCGGKRLRNSLGRARSQYLIPSCENAGGERRGPPPPPVQASRRHRQPPHFSAPIPTVTATADDTLGGGGKKTPSIIQTTTGRAACAQTGCAAAWRRPGGCQDGTTPGETGSPRNPPVCRWEAQTAKNRLRWSTGDVLAFQGENRHGRKLAVSVAVSYTGLDRSDRS